MHTSRWPVVVRTLLLALVAGALALGPRAAAAQAAMVGTWELNVAKSKYTPGPAPKSNTVTYVAAGAGLKLSVVAASRSSGCARLTGASAPDGRRATRNRGRSGGAIRLHTKVPITSPKLVTIARSTLHPGGLGFRGMAAPPARRTSSSGIGFSSAGPPLRRETYTLALPWGTFAASAALPPKHYSLD